MPVAALVGDDDEVLGRSWTDPWSGLDSLSRPLSQPLSPAGAAALASARPLLRSGGLIYLEAPTLWDEERLAALSAEKNQLEERLTQGLAPAEIAECGKRLKACGDEVDALEERWLELSETIQEIENSA